MNQPKVSVVMITYGHQDFIIEAIEGVVKQKCDFDLELIIANDCSPDTTDEIVKIFLANNEIPKNICVKYTKHVTNIGMKANFIWALKEAKGAYIALCEGDDYWTDIFKLQKQIDFLDKNPTYVACSHHRFTSTTEIICKEEYNQEIFTQCLVYKNILTGKDYEFLKDVFNMDSFLDLILKTYGRIKFLDFYGAVYRLTGDGVYSSLSILERTRKSIESYKKMLLFLETCPKNEGNQCLRNINTANHNGAVITYCRNNKNFTFSAKLKFFLQNYEYISLKRFILDGKVASFS